MASTTAAQRPPANYPSFFKVYSEDGRETLTSTCRPPDHKSDAKQISCKFVNVRFIPPPSENDPENPLAAIEALRKQLALGGKPARLAEQELSRVFEDLIGRVCPELAKSVKDRKSLGSKEKEYLQHVLSACEKKDGMAFVRNVSQRAQRTCNLWVYSFPMDFEIVRPGQWISPQQHPGSLIKVMKVYELTGKGTNWTLAETRVPTEGSDEQPSRSVWTSRSVDYELPCEFISHTWVQAP